MTTKKVCGIYKIVSPTGNIYIGQSTDIFSRIKKYKNLNCEDQPRLYNSIKKHGWDNHKFEILEECEKSLLNSIEENYIRIYKCWNTKNGLNLRSGGDYGGKLGEESRSKISKSLVGKMAGDRNPFYGKKHSKESLTKMRAKRSEEFSNKMKNVWKLKKNIGFQSPLKGRKLSVETRNKISEAQIGEKCHFYGKKHSKETIDKIKSKIIGRPKKIGKSSKYIGVNGYKRTSSIIDNVRVYRQWVVRVKVNGIRYYIGLFNDEKEAAIAYNKSAIKYQGKFANLNKID